MLNGDILIVGGYGAVGCVIATRLAEKFPGQVVVAGRSYEKATALAQVSGGKIRPFQANIFTAHKTPEILEGVALVVMCLDLPDTQFVELCLQEGVHYIDVTASYDYMKQVEALDGVAKKGNSTVVLSVGIAPGLTNLLARYAQSQFDELENLDIHILLGLGEAHGEAAVRWMVENLNNDFTVMENGVEKPVRSFADGKQTRFPGKLGKRTTYRFDFSDQHVLPRTLGIPSVSMRIAFDSALMTHFMAVMKTIGLFGLLHYQWAQDTLVKLLMRLQFGSEMFVAQVDGYGFVDGERKSESFAVIGEKEARFTGLVAAQVADGLMTAVYPPGVFHIEQLFEPLPFIEGLATYDLGFRYTVDTEN